VQKTPLLNQIESMGGDKMEWAHSVILDGFSAIERVLTETSGSY
jgi:hypothetical protein